MTLSADQRRALDLTRPTVLAAGAGSGKTRVLIERYVLAIEDVGFDLDAVLAVTFTRKATAEMLKRVRERIERLMESAPDRRDAWLGVRERLSDAWIMTIDAFCNRVLASMGPASGLPARRAILTGGALAGVLDQALREVVDGIAHDPADPDREALGLLLREVGRSKLVKHLTGLVQRRARGEPWARDLRTRFRDDPDGLLQVAALARGTSASPATDADSLRHRLQVAMAVIFERLLARYRHLLARASACDFRQLIEDVREAFSDEPTRAAWASRFRHVLVDEFQDTDPVQWEVLRALFGRDGITRPGLFVVGDEKQAIFAFRDSDVATFHAAREEIARAERAAAIDLVDNYRSTPALVDAFNRLSESVFGSGDGREAARHVAMRAARDPAPSVGGPAVEMILGQGPTAALARAQEFHALAARIRGFVDAGRSLREQAILLRKRTHLEAIEATLTRHGIPFRVLGGVGFYDRPEIRALRALMAHLANPEDDGALLGALRSALFAVPDSVLVAAHRHAAGARTALLQKVRAFAQAVAAGDAATPTAEDAPMLLDAVARLDRYQRLAGRLPENEVLAAAIRESDFLLALDVVDPSGRSSANVEKLLDLVSRFQRAGLAGFHDIARAIALAVDASDDPEAQADPPDLARDAVSICTVHAAKGLEWDIVFVPCCESDAGQAGGEAGDPPDPQRVGGVGGVNVLYEVHPDDQDKHADDSFKKAVDDVAKRGRIAEARRLLYVAATRARDRLVFSATAFDTKKGPKAPPANSWRAWVHAAGIAAESGVRDADANVPRRAVGAGPGADAGESAAAPPAVGVAVQVSATSLAALRADPAAALVSRLAGSGGGNGARPAAGDASGAAFARARGVIIHGALEGLAFGVDPASRVRALAAEEGVRGEADLAAIEAHVRAAVERFRSWPVGEAILRAPRGEVLSEVPFEIGDGRVRITGAVDLVHVLPGGGAVVVDFKSDREVPQGRDAAIRMAREKGYADQLAAYAAAARARFGDPVAAWLFFTETGAAVEIVGTGGVWSGAESTRLVEAARAAVGEAAGRAFPQS